MALVNCVARHAAASQLVVGGKRDANTLKMASAAQQVPVKWIAALHRLISQLHLTVLQHATNYTVSTKNIAREVLAQFYLRLIKFYKIWRSYS